MFKLTLLFDKKREQLYQVRISVHSSTLKNAGVKLSYREFEQLVRSPRLFDYVDRVYINQKNNKYIVVEDDVKTMYSNPSDNPIISELFTYKREFEDRVKQWMRTKGIPYVAVGEEAPKPQAEPKPECIWLVPRIRVALGLDTHPKPPELLGYMHGCPIVDRSEKVSFGTSKLITDRPFPDFSVPERRGIGKLMLDRAEYLWQWIENQGRLGIIWWSGGIDSTALLVAMIRTSTPDRMRLVKVGLNQRSIAEYPSFFDKYVKKLPFIFVSHNDGQQIDLTSVHITGEIGDQIFGSDYLQACFNGGGRNFIGKKHFDGNIDAPWQDVMSLFVRDQLKERDLPASYKAPMMETYEKLNTGSPIEINSLFDFWWWSNFNLKYTHVANRLQLNTSDIPTASKRVKAFFDTEEFQRWSIANHDKKIKNTWKSYKYPLKRFVYNFNKDIDWFKHKTKVQSLRMGSPPGHLLMDSSYRMFTIVDKENLINTYFGGEDARG